MLRVLHVDKINNDDAAQIAQAQLPRDRLGRFKIGLEDRVVKAAATDKTAGVDVDRGERFGRINDQVAARFESHFPLDGAANFFFDAVEVEDRPIAFMSGQTRRQRRHVVQRKRKQGVLRFGGIDQDGLGVFADQVSHYPL